MGFDFGAPDFRAYFWRASESQVQEIKNGLMFGKPGNADHGMLRKALLADALSFVSPSKRTEDLSHLRKMC